MVYGDGRAPSLKWVAILGFSIPFLLVGCGGGGGGGSQATATPTATAPAATATPTMGGPTATVPPGNAGAGVAATIEDVTVDAGGEVSVEFTLTDAAGVAITPVLSSTQNPQQARVRFNIAHLEEYSGGGDLGNEFTRYVNDIDAMRPRYDSQGTLETIDAASGLYRYVFNAKLPEGFDATQTHSVGMQVDREFDGEELSANPVFDFVPAGGEPQIRAASATERCNQCHDPLILHGNRREFRLCTLCHTQAAVDEMGRSINFSVMIHKIHRGEDLPSVVNGEPGATYAIFSSFQRADVVFAQKDEEGNVTGVAFPRDIRDCEVCHEDAPTAENHMTKPAAAPCTSCHDDVNPSQVETAAGPPGTNHFNGRSFPDGDCAFCHVPDTGVEFDVSVEGAHVIPARSDQLEGLNVEITGVSNTAPGQMPTVRFRVSTDDGTPLTDLSGLNRLALNAAGPTTDYTQRFTSTVVGGGANGMLVGPDGEGFFDYTTSFALPEDATGTWAIGAEARRPVMLERPDEEEPITVNEAAANPVVTFDVGAEMPLVRRMVVADENCQSCHGEFSRGFSIHGGLRNRVEYCVICHNPNQSDVDRRRNDEDAVARGEATAPIDFKVMIHKIHRGEELANHPYIIYGFGGPNDFSEVLFPGDLRHCEKCHLEGTQLLPPFPGTALGTRLAHLDPETGDEVVDGRLGPITSVCTACHDDDATGAHADTQTASDGREACAICHSEGREEAVSEVHAR